MSHVTSVLSTVVHSGVELALSVVLVEQLRESSMGKIEMNIFVIVSD